MGVLTHYNSQEKVTGKKSGFKSVPSIDGPENTPLTARSLADNEHYTSVERESARSIQDDYASSARKVRPETKVSRSGLRYSLGHNKRYRPEAWGEYFYDYDVENEHWYLMNRLTRKPAEAQTQFGFRAPKYVTYSDLDGAAAEQGHSPTPQQA